MATALRVTDDDVADFHRDGFAVLRGALEVGDVDRLGRLIEADRGSEAAPTVVPGAGRPDADRVGAGHDDYGDVNSAHSRDFFLRVPGVSMWHHEVGLSGAAAALLGTGAARAVRDRLFVKAPGSADRTMWHQDQPLTQEAPGDLVVLWIPLVIDEGAAPLRVARASQHGPKMIESGIAWWRHVDGTQSAVVEADEIEAQFDIVTAVASVGDVVALHGLVLHASEPNRSSIERVALSTRFVPA